MHLLFLQGDSAEPSEFVPNSEMSSDVGMIVASVADSAVSNKSSMRREELPKGTLLSNKPNGVIMRQD